MRKIEQDMLNAISNHKTITIGNTKVIANDDGIIDILLHNNNIATIGVNGFVSVNEYTLKRFQTNTTKSRLRALGVNVYTKAGKTYLNDNEVV